MAKAKSAYAQAGVDIDAKMNALARAKKMIKGTMNRNVVADWGLFGGLFKSPGRDKVLVSSVDGVGTKLKVAAMAGRHDTIGQDLVNHCVNDILAQGAEPLFFLDYVGTSKVDPNQFAEIVSGLCKACKENGCVLIGGETAEMPGLYPPKEYDLVGAIVGVVDRKRIIAGKFIRPGDVMIGLPSSGLHTNGYSLARRVVFQQARLGVKDKIPGTGKTVADALLAVHKSYLKPIRELRKVVSIRGLAHITGGGLVDNVPRILPKGVTAVFDRATWKVPALFEFMQKAGRVDRDEMYRVFNMGVGMVVFVKAADTLKALKALRAAGEKPWVIGNVLKGQVPVKLVN